jgi:hypothetical protein
MTSIHKLKKKYGQDKPKHRISMTSIPKYRSNAGQDKLKHKISMFQIVQETLLLQSRANRYKYELCTEQA